MKKSWHPLLIKNQERVWLEERKALAEKKKLDQLKKELEEERHMQELQRLQEEQTGKKRAEKLEWMYSTPATGGSTNPNELEEYLLGRKRVDKILTGDENAKLGASHKNFIAVQNANSARDTAAKIREDPLFAIKQQEQTAYQALMSNPLRLKALREKAGFKDKSDSKERHRRRHHREEGDSYSRDRDELHSRHSHREYRRDSRSRSPPRRRRSASPPPRRDQYDVHEQRRRGSDDSRYRRSRSPGYYRRRSPARNGDIPRQRDDDHGRTGLRSSNLGQYHSRRSSPPPRPEYRSRSPRDSSSSVSGERARRLALMSANADELAASRITHFEAIKSREERERVEEDEKRRKAFKNGGTGDFMRLQSKAVYGGGIGLEERLKRNRGVLVREAD